MDEPSQDMIDRLLDAAFARTAQNGWLATSIAEIAAEADVPIAETFAVLPTKTAILEALIRRAEERMLVDAEPDFAETPRDRLFEMVMLHLDALSAYRDGLARVFREVPADPITMLILLPGLGKSFACMLEAAGLSTSGLRGALRVQGLTVIYLDTLRVWIDDASPDTARTMATLDRGLRRAESAMGSVNSLLPNRLCLRRANPSTDDPGSFEPLEGDTMQASNGRPRTEGP